MEEQSQKPVYSNTFRPKSQQRPMIQRFKPTKTHTSRKLSPTNLINIQGFQSNKIQQPNFPNKSMLDIKKERIEKLKSLNLDKLKKEDELHE